jgi:hypothetical protein
VTAKIAGDLGISFEVTAEKPVLRLGSIRARPLQQIATGEAAPANPKSK